MAVARALTLVESRLPQHQQLAQELLSRLPAVNDSIRIGLTGPPGAGKSTLIESLGLSFVEQGHSVGVLAIDPSSRVTGGSILGDKMRMERLALHPAALIRPSPASDSLGGVARRTREAILVLEAAGFKRIIVETVGVGQSETVVSNLVDVVVVLALPAAGDEIQGLKRGLMEIADIVFVNKAEEPLLALARQTANSVSSAQRLFSSSLGSWRPRVLLGSALIGQGLEALVSAIADCHGARMSDGHRARQVQGYLVQELQQRVYERFLDSDSHRQQLHEQLQLLAAGQQTVERALAHLLSGSA